jgi:beta-glucanase (GH16 family)
MGRNLFIYLVVSIISIPTALANDWKLVWSDEFNYSGLPNSKKWNYEVGFIRNRELQYYTKARKENARVENGTLVIESRKEKFKNPNYNPDTNRRGRWSRSREFADYTSASLITRGKASWCYGRIEVRAKLPTGRGTWPAIWMLGTNIREVGWPTCGEIDIMENVGFDPNKIHANSHTKKYNHARNTGKGSSIKVSKPYKEFHIYAIEWYPDRGEAVWPYDKEQYLILNTAIGGAWGGQKGIDESIFPQKFYIDYVRIYQKRTASKPAQKK